MGSREEYLKRYLSNDKDDTRKRKKKLKTSSSTQPRLRIVDDDITVRDVAPGAEEAAENDLYEDDAPTVSGRIDDRPEEVQQLELYQNSKQWKTMGVNDQDAKLQSANGSPRRKLRHDSSSDHSPVRKQRLDSDSDSDKSPVRKQRHDSDSDKSPVRKHKFDGNVDHSPPRRTTHQSDSDQSPPRRRTCKSDSDQSPPRRCTRQSDSDQSPPRKRLTESKRHRPSRFQPEVTQKDSARATKTLSGLTAGLSTARAMRIENEGKRRREQAMYDQADEHQLGIGAKTIFRDKETGKRRDLVKEGEAEAKENAIKEEFQAKYKAWGKGLAQSKEQAQRVAEAVHEADKPLARGRGDEDLENMLRGQERDGDPMLDYVRDKKRKVGTKVKEIPRYKGPQPPANRFNLWPGYRWDGIDRSNGFEKSLFAKRSERKAIAEDAYKWSVEDM